MDDSISYPLRRLNFTDLLKYLTEKAHAPD